MHPRLGRIFSPDVRDRNYLMGSKLAATAPVGRRLWDIPYLYDQGQTPACTGYSSSAAMSGVYYSDHHDTIQFNAMGLYKWANAHDGDPTPHDGSSVRAAFQGLVAVGDVILASNIPADGVGVAERIQNYVWADTALVDCDINNIITWILNISPVVIGINWYEDMFCQDPKTDQFVAPPGGFLPITGKVAGGHAICIHGVNATDPNNTYFVLRNSWGAWGIHVNDDWTTDSTPAGDILLKKADLITLLSQQGEAGALVDNLSPILPVPPPKPVPPAPTPTPPTPAPTPDKALLLRQVKTEVANFHNRLIKLIGDW
jgi:hypothetical protein